MNRHAIFVWTTVLAIGALAGAPTASAQTQMVPAQTRGVSAGVLAGVNFADLNVPIEPPTDLPPIDVDVNIEKSRLVGLMLGAFVAMPLASVIDFETGAFFTEKGTSLTITITAPDVPEIGTVTAEGTARFRYLEVPALIRVGVGRFDWGGVDVFGGPAFGFRLSATSRVEAEGMDFEEDFGDTVPSFDLGLVVGGRVEIRRVLIDLRYTHGFTNLVKDPEDDDVLVDPVDPIKHRVFSVMAGFRFR